MKETAMPIYRVDAHIPASRHIEITLPDDFPQGVAEIIVRAGQEASKPFAERPLSDDFFAWYDRQASGPHSEEEIAAWIREEREAWGDD
jgi:hypothetical protein